MTPLKRQFFRYALPSMFSQLLNSCFIIVDGLFIGQNLGDAGLAAINVAAIVILAAVGLWRSKTGNIVIHTSVWSGEPEEHTASEQQPKS